MERRVGGSGGGGPRSRILFRDDVDVVGGVVALEPEAAIDDKIVSTLPIKNGCARLNGVGNGLGSECRVYGVPISAGDVEDEGYIELG